MTATAPTAPPYDLVVVGGGIACLVAAGDRTRTDVARHIVHPPGQAATFEEWL